MRHRMRQTSEMSKSCATLKIILHKACHHRLTISAGADKTNGSLTNSNQTGASDCPLLRIVQWVLQMCVYLTSLSPTTHQNENTLVPYSTFMSYKYHLFSMSLCSFYDCVAVSKFRLVQMTIVAFSELIILTTPTILHIHLYI